MEFSQLASESRHAVAIIGGAVSGSEAALACAGRGILAIVIEQNPRPYGKIEDGLPRWHDKLRDKEYARIDDNFDREGVLFVPNTLVGKDADLLEMARDWGLSAVLLANGAWRDRPVGVEGLDEYVGKGLLYQNPFVHWFNHYEDTGYDGPQYEVKDDAIVLGGGLASVDVAKILNLELYRAALRERGIEVSVVDMEHKGIPATLAKLDLTPEALGVKGCTLYYRRRVIDMPVAFPKGDTPEALEKVRGVRQKMIGILAKKYLIRVQELHRAVGAVVRDGQLVGLKFRRTENIDGKVTDVEGSDYEVESPLTVSSIGSVPQGIEGVPMRGELYDYADWDTGVVRGLPGVFGLGNVLTGKGNIKDSRINSQDISQQVMERYLGLSPSGDDLMDGAHESAAASGEAAAESAIRRAKTTPEQLGKILDFVKSRWEATGYTGDYRGWVKR